MSEERVSETPTVESSVGALQDIFGEFLDSASVTRVYGEPVEKGDTTIIPAAEVLVGLAMGLGFGSGGSPEGQGQGTGEGGGGGGGGRTLSRPVAIIIAEPGRVRVEPVVDASKVALAAVTAFGFMLAVILGLVSPKKMMKQMRGED